VNKVSNLEEELKVLRERFDEKETIRQKAAKDIQQLHFEKQELLDLVERKNKQIESLTSTPLPFD
jgi:hypothetical protein